MIASYKNRSFPYVFTLVLLGALTLFSINEACIDSKQQAAAIFLSLTFSGAWIMFLVLFLDAKITITIYTNKIRISGMGGAQKDIDYQDIESFRYSKTFYEPKEYGPIDSSIISGGHSDFFLQINMKDGVSYSLPLNDIDERQELIETFSMAYEDYRKTLSHK